MNLRLHLSLLLLSAAALACSIFVGGPDLPEPSISPSPDVAQKAQADIEAAVKGALVDGRFSVSLTQEQLTAFLASRLGPAEDPILSQPQVVLGNQQIVIYGRARSWIFEANVALTATFTVDAAGQPRVLITEAEFGPLPMPPTLQEALAAALDEALTGYLGPAALGFRLETIEISGGVMNVTGRLR